MNNEWVSDEYYYFQFAMARESIAAGTPKKCAAGCSHHDRPCCI